MLAGLFSKNKQGASSRTVRERGDFVPADKSSLSNDPVERAWQAGRLGLILGRAQEWQDQPGFQEVFERALCAVDERFAVVPDGMISLALTVFDEPGQPEVDVETESYLIARHAVTNADYQLFVDDEAYEQTDLWPEDIWPHLIDFKDQTGEPGPRFWRNGRHDRRLARHPAVGVCYHEAAAYCQWAGLRLPTEAQWQMAASWRVRSAAHTYRRYPWGDGISLDCCNIWATGVGGTWPVDACPAGAAPNGVLQLIGNTWEWTASDFQAVDREGRTIVGNSLMKSIRGGAYDTYFAWQATGAFRSGLESLARRHNVGFRCALTVPED